MNKQILISAYGCEPFKGSEIGVGWQWVLQIAKNNIVHVVTRKNNKEIIENNIPSNLKDNLYFHYYDTNNFIRKIKKGDKRLYLYYTFWQIGAYQIFRKLSQKYKFDYSIHISFGSYWMPTLLPFLNIPFIYGPIGGADAVPISFLSLFPFKGRLMQYFRYILNFTAPINPLVMIPCIKAKYIICRTKNNVDILPSFLHKKTKIQLETGMILDDFPEISSKKIINTKIRLITTGRLIPLKNIITVIKSLAILKNDYDFTYTIIGSGPEEGNIRKKIKELGLSNNVFITKQIPREQVLKELDRADIFLFPSLKEGGSWALMEAMAMKLPTICLDWTGMSVIADQHSSIKLKVSNPQKMVIDMAQAIAYLIDNPDIRIQMGEYARKRIETVFNWDNKRAFIEEILNE